MGGTTTWRGVTLDTRTAAMMDEVVRLCPSINIDPSQGSWSGAAASAGTHSGCGAIDITGLDATRCNELVSAMRRVGFAAWHRTPEQSDWVRHAHGIAVQPGGKYDRGCLSGGAHDQVIDYYEGRNGLASNAPDDGPREHVGTIWESYKQAAKEPPPRRAQNMITIKATDSNTIYLLGINGLAGIANPSDLKEIMAAIANPNHTATVTRATLDAIKKVAA